MKAVHHHNFIRSFAALGALLCFGLLFFLSGIGRKEEKVRPDQPNQAEEKVSPDQPDQAEEKVRLDRPEEGEAESSSAEAGEGASEQENILPDWVSWQEKTLVIPGSAAGTEDRAAVLSDRKVKIGDWESPEGCLIQDMLVCDIDHDGEEELLLLLWKIGTNVDLKLWNQKDEEVWGQHIYIFDLPEDEVKPIWWASDIGILVDSWEFHEKRRLVIQEHTGKESCWDWESFGLKLKDTVSFLATGDLMIHRAIYDYGLRSGKGFSFLFDRIRTDLEEADVSVCQQETVLVSQPEKISSYPYFGSPAEVGEEIVRSGFDVAELATNHMLDKGREAVDFTAGLYDAHQVMYIGVQPSSKPENEPCKILERQGIRFALFNYTFSTNGQPVPEAYPNMIHTLFDEERVKEELLKGKEDSDFVIVFVHWGTEYDREIDAFQKKWADIFLDCGVGVVVGSHPHVLQKMELIEKEGKTMLCYYSLGNLISTMDQEDCQVGGLAKFSIIRTSDGCRLAGYELKEIDSSFRTDSYDQ